MSRADKRIISIFLLLIMIIAQFGSVFATTGTTENGEVKTLSKHLIDSGVDTNKDGKLSTAEWATVKNLELVVDKITTEGIENAVNLKSLILEGIDPNKIDFTKLTKIEKIYIDFEGYNTKNPINIVFPELNNLKEVYINNSYVSSEYFEDEKSIISSTIGSIDLSKLSNLERLEMNSTYPCNIKFPKLSNIKEFYIDCNNNIELDLSNAIELISGKIVLGEDIDSINVLLPNVKLMNDMLVEKLWFTGLEISRIESKIELQRGAIYTKGTCESLGKDSILEINENGEILAKNIGKENITIKDALNRIHNLEVNVFKKDIDTTLGNTSMDVKILSEYNAILKSNGELWRVTSETTAEQIGTNVKDYVSSQVYCQTGGGYAEVEKIIKTDNTVELKININGTVISKNIANISKSSDNGISYINNGDLYEVTMNYITEQVSNKFVMSGVEEIIEDCVVTENATYYRERTGRYKKIANFKISDCINENPILYLTDINGVMWSYDIDTFMLEKVEEDYIEFQEKKEEESWWDNFEKEFLHCGDVIVLNDISERGWNNKFDCEIYARTDGSIWLYSEKSGLTKVIESTVGEEENLVATPVKETIRTKDIENIKIITGFPTGKIVSTWVYESNLNKNFLVEVYNLDNKQIYGSDAFDEDEITDIKDLIFTTGMKIVLSDYGEVKQEYTVVVYGDVKPDGIIDAFDALTLIQGANKKIKFESDVCKEAGRIIAKTGEEPTAVDALAIIKAANNKYTINQSK